LLFETVELPLVILDLLSLIMNSTPAKRTQKSVSISGNEQICPFSAQHLQASFSLFLLGRRDLTIFPVASAVVFLNEMKT